MPDGKICGGEIDYDEGFNHLICTKCGTEYFARDLSKKGDNKKVLVVKKGVLNNMEIVIRRGDQVIKTIRTNSSVDHLERTNMAKRSDKAMMVVGSGINEGRPVVTVRRGNKVVGGTQFKNYSDPGSTENKPFKNVTESQKQNNAPKSIPMPHKSEKPAEKKVETHKTNGNGIPTSTLEVILDNFRVVNETLNKINERINQIEDYITNNVSDVYDSNKLDVIEAKIEKGFADVEDNVCQKIGETYNSIVKQSAEDHVDIVTRIKAIDTSNSDKAEFQNNIAMNEIKNVITELTVLSNQMRFLKESDENATVDTIKAAMKDMCEELALSDKKTYNLVQNFLDSLDINVTEEEDDEEVDSSDLITEDVEDDSSNELEVANAEELEQFIEETTNKEYPEVEIINTVDDHSDLEATPETTPNQEQVTYSADEPIPNMVVNSKEKISLADALKEY